MPGGGVRRFRRYLKRRADSQGARRALARGDGQPAARVQLADCGDVRRFHQLVRRLVMPRRWWAIEGAQGRRGTRRTSAPLAGL